MRILLLTVLLLYCTTITTKAQELEFNGEFLLFREAKTKQPVLIVNDSLAYKGNNMKRIAFKHTDYPTKLQEYKFFNIEKKTYLVHEGCGPVLEYRNDSIVRIDNSFLHRNQYRATKFVYNKEIYFYGGYGLFTFKNILTKYDFNTREWIEVQTFSETPLETRASAFSYLINNDLYIFGGGTKDETKVAGGKQLDNNLWRLHLPTMQWSCNKEVYGISKDDILECILFSQHKNNLYLISNNFNEIDLKKNTLKKYDKNIFYSYSYYFEANTIICVLKNNLNQSKYFRILPIEDAKGKLLATTVFSKSLPLSFNIKIILLIMAMLLCVILLIFRKKIINKLKPFEGILYNQQKELFLYKNKPITVFDEQEKQLLLYLIDQNNEFVALNNLNQLFESNQAETISATVKRREQTVSRLLTKVSKMTGIEEEELILEQKNSEDKRIKDVLLLPKLLKRI